MSVEEEFTLVAGETLAWAEATLPIAAEAWMSN